jgi:hypothetical protein
MLRASARRLLLYSLSTFQVLEANCQKLEASCPYQPPKKQKGCCITTAAFIGLSDYTFISF